MTRPSPTRLGGTGTGLFPLLCKASRPTGSPGTWPQEHLEAISGAVLRTEPKVLVIGLEGKNVPRAFLQLVVRCTQERTRAGAHVALHLQAQKGEWEPWRRLGTLAEPRWPWAFVRADMCQFARASGRGNLVESGALWLADFSLESVG